MKVQVKHNEYVGHHDLVVVRGNGPTLIGQDWLSKLRLNWATVQMITSTMEFV